MIRTAEYSLLDQTGNEDIFEERKANPVKKESNTV
jgi:hypothetical protein